ncbi:MAG: hypothetical protein AB1665_09365, partial [Candidatus Thermoplasmatota archaeon]
LKENGAAITFPLALKKGEKRTFIAEAEIPSNTTLGSIFQLALADMGTVGIVHLQGKAAKAYVGKPAELEIDGAFGDWNDKEMVDDPASDIGNPNIDLLSYGTDCTAAALSIYLNVKGALMLGTLIPFKNEKQHVEEPSPSQEPVGSGGGEVHPVIPSLLIGEDRAGIFIDADNDSSTGYRVSAANWRKALRASSGVQTVQLGSEVIGADYLINITGKNGEVLTSKLERFSGEDQVKWSWHTSSSVQVACDDSQLEAQIGIDGLSITEHFRIYIWMTDWTQNKDASDSALLVKRSAFSTRAGNRIEPQNGAGPDYPPPASGNWVINGETSVWDETITVNGSLFVSNTGKLTLINCTLRMNCTSDGQYKIQVNT